NRPASYGNRGRQLAGDFGSGSGRLPVIDEVLRGATFLGEPFEVVDSINQRAGELFAPGLGADESAFAGVRHESALNENSGNVAVPQHGESRMLDPAINVRDVAE